MLLRCIVLFFWLNVWYSKTILRKETEIGTCQWLSPHRTGCNISPQGGENRSTFKVIICSMHCIYPRKGTETCGNPPKPPGNRLQFIPARGRKLIVVLHRDCVSQIAIYPRKGTETGLSARLLALQWDCNLSPQGDENRSTFKVIICSMHCNLSPQGDKKAPLPLAFVSSGGALLFLIFYFTGWALRLPESSL